MLKYDRYVFYNVVVLNPDCTLKSIKSSLKKKYQCPNHTPRYLFDLISLEYIPGIGIFL